MMLYSPSQLNCILQRAKYLADEVHCKLLHELPMIIGAQGWMACYACKKIAATYPNARACITKSHMVDAAAAQPSYYSSTVLESVY